MPKPYHTIALGGTFDHFHLGHQRFLDTAAVLADELIIGITEPSLLQGKLLNQIIEPPELRTNNVSKYFASRHPLVKVSLVPLSDPYGPTLVENSIQALLVTDLTRPGAERINATRRERHLPPLALELAPLIPDDSGLYLSSSRIRRGLVDRQGRVYQRLFEKPLTPNPSQRAKIQTPLSPVIPEAKFLAPQLKGATRIALVGDSVVESFIQASLPFHYAIIDYQVKRQPHRTQLEPFHPAYTATVTNPPGWISTQAAQAVAVLVEQPTGLLVVKGEEDLLGFPLVALLPLDSLVIYGQPDQGLVALNLTEASKHQILSLIDN